MSSQHPFRGLGIALPTPFTPDDTVDYEALGQLVERQIAEGADYLVVLGTTAETPTLSDAEKANIALFVQQVVRRRIPLVLGMGGNNTRAIMEQMQTGIAQGYDALLTVCPYYNKPTQEGLFQHFVALSSASPLPIILYNVPGRTGVNMLPETVLRIARQCSNVIGIKEASGNIAQIRDVIRLTADLPHFGVISGDDGLIAPVMQAGGIGVISVAANAFTADFRTLVHDAEQAAALQARYAEMIELLFADGNPAGIKALLCLQGRMHNRLRLPLVPASESVIKKMADRHRTCPYIGIMERFSNIKH